MTFSLEPDVTRLVDAGLVAKDWASTPSKGLVTTSLVSFIVRKGNPKNIKTWDDLLKPGVKVLTPNPFTSGAAKWNLLAAYGAKSDGGKDDKAGLDYLRELITKHVKVQDKSGREALQTFTSGTGDVLLSYEYEATTAQKKGEKVDFVTPPDTIRIENPIAVTEKAAPAAKEFVDFVLSKAGQEKFADWGYRPVNQEVFDAQQVQVPRARQACSPSAISAAGRRSTTRCSTRRRARSRRSRRTQGCRPPHERRPPHRPPALRRRRPERRAGDGGVAAVAQRPRPAAAGRARRALARRRPRRPSGTRSPRARRSAPCASRS